MKQQLKALYSHVCLLLHFSTSENKVQLQNYTKSIHKLQINHFPLLQQIIYISYMSQDYLKAPNPAAQLFQTQFADLQLPENSNIIPKTNKNNQKPANKYQEQPDDDDDFFNIQLTEASKIVTKPIEQLTSEFNYSKKSAKNIQQQPTVQAKSKIVRGTRKAGKKQQKAVTKEVDIDNQIGQIAEWAERGAKNNSEDEDFNEGQKVGESEEQVQIRRKIEQKLKKGFNQNQSGGGSSLKAKAQQLKKENDNKMQLNQIKQEPSLEQTGSLIINKPPNTNQPPSISHDTSNIALLPKHPPPPPESSEEEDAWQTVNQQTLDKIKQVKQKRKEMSLKTVLQFYEKEFEVNEKDIEDAEVGADLESEENEQTKEMSFLQKICSCFIDRKQKRAKPKYNASIAKRLIAISKKHLTNGEEQFFMLKTIWERLTGEDFSRYGNHWNKIGFQGRDPATDLRSTGILSLLQWIQFMEAHPKQSLRYFNWSIQFEFPLAITHIKLTAVYLDLLAKGSIKCERWSDFQRPYNCLAMGMMGRVMLLVKEGEGLGNLVEQQSRKLKKQYGQLLCEYDKQFKKG